MYLKYRIFYFLIVINLGYSQGLRLSSTTNVSGAGNGGGAWVCVNRDSMSTIRWAKSIDLYEADKEFSLTIIDFQDERYEQIIEFLKLRISSIDPNLFSDLREYFNLIEKSIEEVDVDLEFIDDSLYRVKPPARDCIDGEINYTQLANFTNYGKVLINKFIFNHKKFSEVDKAALILHEVIYAYLRNHFGDTNSIRARRIVGVLLSILDGNVLYEELNRVLKVKQEKDILGMNFIDPVQKCRVFYPDKNCNIFTIGSPNYEEGRGKCENQRSVLLLRKFAIMATEVTQMMYFSITGENPSFFNEKKHCPVSYIKKESRRKNKKISLCPNNPVEGVSSYAIQKFIQLLNKKTGMHYRLPTEAEWEYAARGGSKGRFPFDLKDVNQYSISKSNSDKQSHPVGSFRTYSNKPNLYGFYDMHGNVSEETIDDFSCFPTQSIDPVVHSDTNKVVKGGNWKSEKKFNRSASRRVMARNNLYVGFRLAKNLE